MAQEFTINSANIETKINQLLPSQGGFGAGVDFSASTMIIPIIDLTETASGSLLRQDLQTSFSHRVITEFTINNAVRTNIINTTGYYRVFGISNANADTTTAETYFELFDGTTYKTITQHIVLNATNTAESCIPFDFTVFLSSGDSLVGTSGNAQTFLIGNTRQIASIDGNLVNPN